MSRLARAVLAAGCGYEIAALLSGQKIPTVTTICRRHRKAEAVLLAWLVIHLHRKERHGL